MTLQLGMGNKPNMYPRKGFELQELCTCTVLVVVQHVAFVQVSL